MNRKIFFGLVVATTIGIWAPALSASQDSVYQGERKTVTLERTGKDLRPTSTFDTEISAPIYRITTRWEWVSRPVIEPVCTQEPGDGHDGDWKGFFNASRAQKPARLAEAIRGVGLRTAERLVDDGYFSSKPRSWDQFRTIILAADRRYNTGFSNEVLVTYGRENAQNLGYFSTESCREEVRFELVLVQVENRALDRVAKKRFHVEVVGAQLLKGEADRLTLSFDGFNDSVESEANYNSYRIVARNELGQDVTYQIQASRRQVQPGNTLSVLVSKEQNELRLKVLDGSYDPELGTDQGTGVMTYKIMRKRPFWFDQEVSSGERQLDRQVESNISTGFRGNSGSEYYVKYVVRRIGSRFYGDTRSVEKNSGVVKF